MCIRSKMTVWCKTQIPHKLCEWNFKLPIVIEVGRIWRCLVPLEVTSMSSVLLSLSLCMYAVAQALTSLMHDCIELGSSDILSGGADICNCKSANEWCMIECESIMTDKGLVHTTSLYLIIALLLLLYTQVFLRVQFLALYFSPCILSLCLPLLTHTLSYIIHLLMTYNYRCLLPR